MLVLEFVIFIIIKLVQVIILKKIRINSELSPLRQELGSLIGERIVKQNKYNRMKILEFEIIKKDLIIKYPDISIIELEKLANNIVSIKYEDNVYEI